MSFSDTAGLAQELAQNLRHGRAFVQEGGGVEVLADCVLVLVRADGAELRLNAQAVMVSDAGAMRGVGLQLRPFGPHEIAMLDAFALREESVELSSSSSADEATPDEVAEDEAEDLLLHEPQQEPPEEAQDEPDEPGMSERPRDIQQQAQHERLRKLTVVEQQKVARHGDLSDRVMLERLYGKGVWEGLLHNPKLTVPEVARIARKGTMPRPLLDFILDNASWTQSDPVRRALLGNPRVSGEGVLKLLRQTPKHELKAITKSTAYASSVREVARKLLKV